MHPRGVEDSRLLLLLLVFVLRCTSIFIEPPLILLGDCLEMRSSRSESSTLSSAEEEPAAIFQICTNIILFRNTRII